MNDMMMQTLMSSLKTMIPEATPENPMAKFINDEIEDITGGDENLELIQSLIVGFANKEPEKCQNMLIQLHNDFGSWYQAQNTKVEE